MSACLVPRVAVAVAWRVRGLLFAGWLWPLACLSLFAASQEERFTIRCDVTITGSDDYLYERRFDDGFLAEKDTATDAITLVGRCEEKIRIVGTDWDTTEESSSYQVSGGGEYHHTWYPRDDPPETSSQSWGYRTDTTQDNPLTSDMTVNLDRKFVDCAFSPPLEFPAVSDPVGINGRALPAAMMAMVYSVTLTMDPIELPTNTTSYTVTRTYSTNIVTPHLGTGQSGQTTANYRCTVTIQRNPAELEAVILTNLPPGLLIPEYAQWLPEGGETEEEVGSTLVLRLIVRQKGSTETEPVSYAKAKFNFRLNDVTREPGVCLNFPAKESAQTTPDLRFHDSDNLLVLGEGLEAASVREDLSEMNFGIDAFDYGAYGTLSITAVIEGQGEVQAFVEGRPDQVFLRIPLDENLNRIADTWERAEGVFIGYDTDPAADGADEPAGQASNGDGIGLYERYRGFYSVKGYDRLKARPKYAFVRDADSLLEWTLKHPEVRDRSFPKVSGCKVLLIDPEQWTGPGWRDEDRVVNFNTTGFGHAADQHALHLEANFDSQPLHPGTWLVLYNDGLPEDEQTKPEVPPLNLGTTYPQPGLPPDAIDSPKTAYKCLIFLGLFPNYELDMVKYHTGGLPDYVRFTSRGYYTNLPPSERQAAMSVITADAEHYIQDHPDDHNTWFRSMLNLVVTHELCHGLAAPHHAPETTDGDWDCVMRYFEAGFWRGGDFPRTPDDRFELGLRKIWPRQLCRSGNGQAAGSCWKAVRVTDKR